MAKARILRKLLDKVELLNAKHSFHYGTSIEEFSPGSRGGSIRILFDAASHQEAVFRVNILEKLFGCPAIDVFSRQLDSRRYVSARFFFEIDEISRELRGIEPDKGLEIWRGYLVDWLEELDEGS